MSAEHGVNFVEAALGHHHETLYSAGFVAIAIMAVGFLANRRLKSAAEPTIPDEKLTIRNFVELLLIFVRNLGDNVMGRENRKYLPFVATLFVYIATANLLGLIPGFSMPTDKVTFNLGIALVVFLAYNFWGIREVGAVNYLKHFCGPVIWLAPLMLLIEIISHAVRPLALSLRLYGNMTGDHLVLQVFTDLTKFIIPVIFYGLGTFVCLMQAFVFTLLTMVYIRFAVAHEESH